MRRFRNAWWQARCLNYLLSRIATTAPFCPRRRIPRASSGCPEGHNARRSSDCANRRLCVKGGVRAGVLNIAPFASIPLSPLSIVFQFPIYMFPIDNIHFLGYIGLGIILITVYRGRGRSGLLSIPSWGMGASLMLPASGTPRGCPLGVRTMPPATPRATRLAKPPATIPTQPGAPRATSGGARPSSSWRSACSWSRPRSPRSCSAAFPSRRPRPGACWRTW